MNRSVLIAGTVDSSMGAEGDRQSLPNSRHVGNRYACWLDLGHVL